MQNECEGGQYHERRQEQSDSEDVRNDTRGINPPVYELNHRDDSDERIGYKIKSQNTKQDIE